MNEVPLTVALKKQIEILERLNSLQRVTHVTSN